uniref:ABC transporter ATP-binding protein n=1 Tax=Nioella sediminis TaxID=1912092 RepID=UPI000A644B37
MSLLKLSHVSAFYGASQALFDVHLDLAEGEVLALMGRNGMGKSTTVKVICRMLKNRGGSVMFDGQDLGSVPAHKAARAGIGLVPEGRRCFAPLTVQENLIAAARKGHWDMARVSELFPRLGERQDQVASSLSGGEQQML